METFVFLDWTINMLWYKKCTSRFQLIRTEQLHFLGGHNNRSAETLPTLHLKCLVYQINIITEIAQTWE